jgi:hypothetical protein
LDIQALATGVYSVWSATPDHPGLHFKCVSERHAVFSVRIGLRWRALGYREVILGEDTVTWFWIGSHAEYDQMIANV